MSLGKRVFVVVFLALLAWSLSLSPPANARERHPQWHTLKTLSGDIQVYGYTKDTTFGEIVVECDPDTGELTGHAYLNAYVGEEERLVGIEEESYADWKNPRTLNFLECDAIAPNIPSNIDLDIEYHWEHPNEIIHYKPGPPIWIGTDSGWTVLAPAVPNKMLAVVKATNPNTYPVSATVKGRIPIKFDGYGSSPTVEAESSLEIGPGETKYVKLPDAPSFLAVSSSPLEGRSAYSESYWTTSNYQILSDEYPEQLKVGGITTIDVPPYTPVGGPFNFENMIYHPNQNTPLVVEAPFDLATRRLEPNWTRSYKTSEMNQGSGSFYGWDFIYTPVTGLGVVTDTTREMNGHYFWMGSGEDASQIYTSKGWSWYGRIRPNYWWPYNDGWNSVIPTLTNNPEHNASHQIWMDNYSFIPDTVTPPYVPPRDDGCGGTIPGYQPPDIAMGYGNITSTPIHAISTYRRLDGRPALKNQLNINACTVTVYGSLTTSCETGAEGIQRWDYTWNGSDWNPSVYTFEPLANQTPNSAIIRLTVTNIVQGVNSGGLTATFGKTTSWDCSNGNYTFESTPQELHLPRVAQLDAQLQEKVGVALPITTYQPPYVPGYYKDDGTCVPGYLPDPITIYSLPSDVTLDSIVIPPGTTTVLAEQKTIEIPFSGYFNSYKLNGLKSVLSSIGGSDEVIFPSSINVNFQGADPARAWMYYRHYSSRGEWEHYIDCVIGPSSAEGTEMSYYNASNPYNGAVGLRGSGQWAETFPRYENGSYFSYYRVLLNGNVFPYTWNP